MGISFEKPSLYGETLESLTERVTAAGFAAFRAGQVMHWLYRKRADGWEAMTNLPKDFRAWLESTFVLHPTVPVLDKRSNDVTRKFLMELADGSLIETVLILAPQTGVGREKSRRTVCVSIQVGCAYGCRFCASGMAGFRRNLTAGEVVSQLMRLDRWAGATADAGAAGSDVSKVAKERPAFDNIVFMGMGEPLANYDALVQAIRILNAGWGLNFGARRITVSTCGLAPQIERLAGEGVGVRLAISLHGATNEVRERIMPVNKRYPLERLIPAAKAFQAKHGRMLTLEFILIEGLNDGLEQARELARIARDLHAHVNCIPYNTVEGLPWRRPGRQRQEAFVEVLREAKVSVTIRREKGHDIDAACGQLRLKKEGKIVEGEAGPDEARADLT